MRWYFLSPWILQKMIWLPTRGALRFFGRAEINGLENIELIGSNAIFACNHASEIDALLLPSSIPFWSHFSPVFYITRGRKFYSNSGWRQHFYGGILFKMWGGFPAFTGLRDYEKALCHHVEIIEDGGSLCVFPEGGITPDGTVQEGKGGVAYLAYATKTPIIPVHFEGTFGMSVGDFFARRHRLRITFGKPIYVRDEPGLTISIKDCKIYANRVMDAIRKLGHESEPVPARPSPAHSPHARPSQAPPSHEPARVNPIALHQSGSDDRVRHDPT